MTTRQIAWASSLLLTLALLGCGTGDTFTPNSTVVRLTIERMTTDAGLPRNEADQAQVPARIPATFELRVDDLSQVVGTSCTVTFVAEAGTPFEGGTSDRVSVDGLIERNGVVMGETPIATQCAPDPIVASVEVMLPSGMTFQSRTSLVAFVPPTIDGDGITPNMPFPMMGDAVPIQLPGEGLAHGGGSLTVQLHWESDEPILEEGSTTATTLGQIRSDDLIEGVTPLVGACDAVAVSARLVRVVFEDDGCAWLPEPVSFTWVAPRVGGVAPQTLPPLRQSRVAIGGNSFGAAETPVEIHWRASNAAGEPLDEAHFIAPDGSFRSTIVTTGTVMTDTRIEADAPRVRQPASREGSFAILEELVFLPSDGRQVCAVLAVNGPIQFRITAPRDVVQQLIELAPMADFIKYRAKEPSKGFIDETLAKALGGFKLGADPAHVQGIVRLDPKPGRPPTFVVSASGNPTSGFLYTVRMNSRGTPEGERIGTNLLERNGAGAWETPSPTSDYVSSVHVSEYQHLGGAQVLGDVLVVAVEDPVIEGSLPKGALLFYDVSNPDEIREFDYRINFHHKMGAAGLTRLLTGEYLLVGGGYTPNDTVMGGWRLHWYAADMPDLLTALRDWEAGDAPLFQNVGGWSALYGQEAWPPFDVVGADLPSELAKDWSLLAMPPTVLPNFIGSVAGLGWPVQGETERLGNVSDTTFQNLSLVTQEDGAVFLVGTKNLDNFSPIIIGDNIAVAYRVRSITRTGDPTPGLGTRQDMISLRDTPDGPLVPRFWSLTARAYLHQCDSTRFARGLEGDSLTPIRLHGNFNAAGYLYQSPRGELILYGSGHNLGANPRGEDLTGRIAEWTHRDLASQQPADQRPWINLYNAVFGWDRRFAFDCENRVRVLVEQPRVDEDDFDNFAELDNANEPDVGDRVNSIRWFAPVGWDIILWKDNRQTDDGGPSFVLRGTGRVEVIVGLDDDVHRFRKSDGGDGGKVREEVSAVTFRQR